jgi:2-iminobutanoate/2-iminopropanoate deaminase
MKQEIKTNAAQSAPGLLSQALVVNNLIFTSGFIHATPDGKMVQGSTEEKFKQVMVNIEETLKSANAKLDNIIKATIYVTDMAILPDMNKLYVTYFNEPFPVREAVCVKSLPLGADIEISVIAEKNS